MGVKVKQLATKKSAIAATQKPAKSKPIKAKKPAKAAKPKKKSGATVAAKKKSDALTVDPKRQAKAIEIDGRMFSAVKSMIAGSEDVVEIAGEMEKGGFWKDLPEKFSSFTAWMNKYAEQANVSIRTLRGGISFAKAAPQLSAAERKKIGPRKGAKIAAAAKTAAEQGVPLDPEILEKAAERTEQEVEEDLIARGLKQRPEPEPPDMGVDWNSPEAEGFYHEPNSATDAPRETYTGVDDGVPRENTDYGAQPAEVPAEHHKSPMQSVHEFFGATPEEYGKSEAVKSAIDAFQAIYSDSGQDRTAALENICAEWLKTQCVDDVRFPNQTNAQAADSLKPKKSNGKKKERKS